MINQVVCLITTAQAPDNEFLQGRGPHGPEF